MTSGEQRGVTESRLLVPEAGGREHAAEMGKGSQRYKFPVRSHVYVTCNTVIIVNNSVSYIGKLLRK